MRQVDPNQQTLKGIAERIETALKRRPLLPLQSLQYRLGEVGRSRIHPYALRRALGALQRDCGSKSSTPAPLQPWQPEPHLFASPELSAREARALAVSHRADLEQLTQADWEKGFAGLLQAISQATGGLEPVEADGLSSVPSPLAGTFQIAQHSQAFALRQVAGVRLWLTQECGWLRPDDPRLWAFLLACVQQDSRPLLVARYIDPASFVLFKALGIRGLQYYSMWAPGADLEHLVQTSERVGWFNVKAAEEASEHRLFEQVPHALNYLTTTEWDQDAREAVHLAASLGLVEGRQSNAEGLLRWAKQTSLSLPEDWIESVERWTAWTDAGPLRIALKQKRRQQQSQATPAKQNADEQDTERDHPLHPREDTHPEAEEGRGYGRETTVTRVPIRLR